MNITREMLFCLVGFPRVLCWLLCFFRSICSLLAQFLENMDCHFTVMRMTLRFICLLKKNTNKRNKLNHVGVESLMACLADVKAWLSLNFYIFNEKITEIVFVHLNF